MAVKSFNAAISVFKTALSGRFNGGIKMAVITMKQLLEEIGRAHV